MGLGRTAWFLAASLVTCAGVAASCTLSTSLDGLTGRASPVPDADSAPDVSAAGDGSGVGCGASLFCEDFEGALDPNVWNPISQVGGTVGLDPSFARGGSQSLHVHVDAITPTSPTNALTIQHAILLPPTFYLRVFVAAPDVSSTAESFLTLIQNHDPFGGFQLSLQDGRGLTLTSWANTPTLDRGGNNVVPLGKRWFCIEEEVVRGSPSGQLHVWQDGVLVGALDSPDLTTPEYGLLDLGLGMFQPPPQGARDLWLDDLIVDTAPIGCTR